MAFIAISPPGMLNMNTASLTHKNGLNKSLLFISGTSLVVIFQAYVAVVFSKYLQRNPEIITNLKYLGVIVFLILSFFFYKQTKKEAKTQTTEKNGNLFMMGLGVSAINMMAIPYYLFLSTVGVTKGWFSFNHANTLAFALGASLGVFAMLLLYAALAKYILDKYKNIAKNTNLILSLIFLILAVGTLLQMWHQAPN